MSKQEERVNRLKNEVVQLRRELNNERIPVSQAAKDLMNYCETRERNDFLLTGVVQKRGQKNPYKNEYGNHSPHPCILVSLCFAVLLCCPCLCSYIVGVEVCRTCRQKHRQKSYDNWRGPWLIAEKVIRHNPPLTGLSVHALPVLNHNRTDHNTKQWSTGA